MALAFDGMLSWAEIDEMERKEIAEMEQITEFRGDNEFSDDGVNAVCIDLSSEVPDGFTEVKKRYKSKKSDYVMERDKRRKENYVAEDKYLKKLANGKHVKMTDGMLNSFMVQYNQPNPDPDPKKGKCHFIFLNKDDIELREFLKYNIKKSYMKNGTKSKKYFNICYGDRTAPLSVKPILFFHHETIDTESDEYIHYGMLMLIINSMIPKQKYIDAIHELTELMVHIRNSERSESIDSTE